MIVLKNVTKEFGRHRVLSDISLRIEPGAFVCVTGPSGAGKSTLLGVLVGAETVTDGTVEVDGVDLRTVPLGALQVFRRKVGVVFQDYKLLSNRTVAENVAFPLEVCGAPDALIRKRVPELLKRMGLTERAGALPQELSGGERARTAIARAIVHKPLILLADEPTGNLDASQARDVMDLFREIHAEGTTVILATHDVSLVHGMRPQMVHIEGGKIVEDRTAHGAKPAHKVHPEKHHEKPAEEHAEPEAAVAETPAPAEEEAQPGGITVHEEKHPEHAHKAHAAHKPGRKVRITSIHSE
jgi:cell division transport system ATP-binding protein